MLKCSKCGLDKPLDRFEVRTDTQSFRRQCRDCRNAVQEETRKTIRRLIFDYLTSHPCIDCGTSNPIVLQFDHVRGDKSFMVSQAISKGLRWPRIQEEIEKCEIRCANCHMIKTADQLGWYATLN